MGTTPIPELYNKRWNTRRDAYDYYDKWGHRYKEWPPKWDKHLSMGPWKICFMCLVVAWLFTAEIISLKVIDWQFAGLPLVVTIVSGIIYFATKD